MTKMDRPDGLGLLWIAAGAGLALLFVVVTVVAIAGKSALLAMAVGAGQPGGGAPVIAGLLTVALLIAGIVRWRGVHTVRMWMLTVLAGMTCGAWIVVLLAGGGGGV
ncbi:hypothetical protein SAMN05444004_105193 [Jannaschia faecimaris]|uniref:Uncharacterized protein n=1 Tax=Jannaschia faecimaris TaxID=1244108 RepID=A0A1H3PW38_9RHOB|nr:hypothetical protein [Jannaschia faecimaris]SDZ05276.1 hypothetical protein SAMN05444004_105193 [Jannaschia faecimaris]